MQPVSNCLHDVSYDDHDEYDDDDDHDEYEDDDDHDEDYFDQFIIGAVCVCVCHRNTLGPSWVPNKSLKQDVKNSDTI